MVRTDQPTGFTWPDKEAEVLCETMDQQYSLRQKTKALGKKCVHVAFRKEQVENEVRQICQLVHELVHSYAGTKKSAMELALEGVKAIGITNAQRIVEIISKLEEK